MFPDIGAPIADAVNRFVDWLVVEHGAFFESIANAILVVLVAIEQTLRNAPPLVILVAVGLIAYAASRHVLLSLAMVALTWLIGSLGLWEQAMQTIALLIVAVGIAIVLGIPFGVLTARSAVARAVVNPVLDLMQTIPSFVYLIPAAMLFGLGKVPAILATVIYATRRSSASPTSASGRSTTASSRPAAPSAPPAGRCSGASRSRSRCPRSCRASTRP